MIEREQGLKPHCHRAQVVKYGNTKINEEKNAIQSRMHVSRHLYVRKTRLRAGAARNRFGANARRVSIQATYVVRMGADRREIWHFLIKGRTGSAGRVQEKVDNSHVKAHAR